MKHFAAIILLCGFLVLSQHRGSEGGFWYRTEVGPVSADECRALLKRVTTRSKVGFTKWYDATTPQLEKQFGHAAVPTMGSWIGCWPEGTDLSAPDS
jgi:hypothetical protein